MTSHFTRRDFLRATAAGAVSAGLFSSLGCEVEGGARKPNVIILFIDDLGHGDIGCFGNTQTPTPHMDALAKEGARLTMNYITNPPCSPSRCSLMMGMYAQRFKKFGMARGLPIPDDQPTLAEFMRDAGHVTGQIGKWDLGGENQGPHQRGFMEVARWPGKQGYELTKPDGTQAYRTEHDGNNMVEFVERNKDKPFFLYFSPLAIHSSLKNTPKKYCARVKGDKAWYGGAVVAVDDQIGKLLATLKKHDLEKNTLILLTGDNGAGNGGSSAPYRGGKGGGTQQEGWVHTPGIAWWPGTIPAGAVYDGLACTLDYYATAAAACGRKIPKQCDGTNLLPYLSGKSTGDAHEYLFWYNADPKDSRHRHLSAVRWKQWRLLLNKKTKAWHLYDLHKDPKEETDLATKHPDVVARLKQKHEEFVAQLPPLKSIPSYSRTWTRPPAGWGWLIGDGKAPATPVK